MIRTYLLIAALISSISLFAQDTITLSDYAVQVAGTSTLHAWTVDVNKAQGQLALDTAGTPTYVHMEFEVETMVSGRGPVMDGKVKKALKAQTHPWITFESSSIVRNSEKLNVIGLLDIGGVKENVELEVMSNHNNYTTTSDLSFSQFDIIPPSAMFGQIKCGDDISITFDVTFSK